MFLKKLIALGLVACTLLAVGCSSKPDESKDTSNVESKDDTSTVPLPNIDVEKLRGEIDALYTNTPAVREGKIKNQITGMKYTTTVAASTEYPDTQQKMLTDGVFADRTFSGGGKDKWVGYKPGGSTITIEVDFGKTIEDITDIGLSLCKDATAGIGLPGIVNIYIDQNGEYKLLGTLYAPIGGSDSMIHKAVLLPTHTFNASKVKIELKNPATTWLFIDELIVGNYTKDEIPDGDFYGSFDVPEIKTPVLWDSSESDYNQKINLAKGKSYQIRAGLSIQDSQKVPNFNTKESIGLLTDDAISTYASYSGDKWFRFTGASNREVVIDLEKTGAVSGYSIGFLRDSSAGVSLPTTLIISVSEDGVGWEKIAEHTDITTSKTNDIVRVIKNLDKPIRARYFKAFFTVAPHTWVDEITVTGTKNVAGAKEVKPDKIEDIEYPNRYLAPSDIGGTKDVFLTYLSPGSTVATKEQFLPMVAYMENNKIVDTLFDSYLFLPVVKFLYDGGTKKPLKKADWQSYIDNQFLNDKNMDALEAAVGDVKTELGLNDYKVTVFLSILFPVKSQTAFGEVGGKNLNFSNLEDRKTAIKWQIDEQMRQFNAKGYKNITLQGFYWFTEEIDYSDAHIKELIRFTTDYVRSKQLITTWIPYFQASGFADWQKLGFDFACYQPNYAFNHSIPIKRIYEAAETAKKLGMCVELEVNSAAAADISRLKAYYYVGSQVGFMKDAVHMYYLGGFPGVVYTAYKSKDPYIHSLYKDTYKFIKGTFNANADNFEDISVEGDTKVTGQLDFKGNEYALGLVLTQTPRYGAVKFKANGAFEYIPYKDISGTDSFTVIVDFGFTQSEPITITVNSKR